MKTATKLATTALALALLGSLSSCGLGRRHEAPGRDEARPGTQPPLPALLRG